MSALQWIGAVFLIILIVLFWPILSRMHDSSSAWVNRFAIAWDDMGSARAGLNDDMVDPASFDSFEAEARALSNNLPLVPEETYFFDGHRKWHWRDRPINDHCVLFDEGYACPEGSRGVKNQGFRPVGTAK